MTAAPVNPRPHPVDPDAARWATAVRDYEVGLVTSLVLGVGEESVEVAVTRSWLRDWQRAALSTQDRAAVRAACTQIAKDRVHPCLGKRVAAVEPVGSTWMASPVPGVTVTWRAHWSSPEVPVLMTFVHDPIA